MAFLDWSTTAGSNTSIGGIGIQGSNAVQNFDNAFREIMAQLKSGVDGKMTLLSKSAGYTAVANDNNDIIRFSAAATLSLTAAATLGSGWHCIVQADGGAVTIDPNSSETINGAATLLVPDGGSTLVICDGTNFRALEDFQLAQSTVDIASATTTDLSTVGSFNVRITGTTTITGFGTAPEGTLKFVRMAGALTLTHNATSLILPNGGANITTAANDCFIARSLGSGNWLVMTYQAATGAAVGTLVDRAYADYTTYVSISTSIPLDDTIPQSSEGALVLTAVITPKSATNRLRARAVIPGTTGTGAQAYMAAIFSDASANALTSGYITIDTANYMRTLVLEVEWVPGSTSTRTITVRAGPSSGATLYLNGNSSGRLLGGTAKCTLIVEEFKA